MSSRTLLVALGLSALSTLSTLSCRGVNAAYCRDHPGDPDCRVDSGIATACTNNSQCTHMTPICDISNGMCVQCTSAESGACGGITPVCGANSTCRSCAADSECESQSCLADGACAVVGSVLYAAPDGDATSRCEPLARCTLVRAIDRVDSLRTTIQLDAGRYDLDATLTLTANVLITGRGAVIARNALGTGPTLAIADGTTVGLDHVTITGGDGDTTGSGIACTAAELTGRAISVEDNAAAGIHSEGCEVTLARARITDNQGAGIAVAGGGAFVARSLIAGNQRGGVAVATARFALRNNFVVRNGDPMSAFGGVLISQITTRATHVLEFNTVAHNQTTVGSVPGVICSVVTTPLTFGNNIVYGNATGTQVEGGNCLWTYSDIGPVPADGTTNLNSDPQFIAPAQNNFHLQVASPLRDAADPAAVLADDIDGDARPQGSARDVGADEIQ